MTVGAITFDLGTGASPFKVTLADASGLVPPNLPEAFFVCRESGRPPSADAVCRFEAAMLMDKSPEIAHQPLQNLRAAVATPVVTERHPSHADAVPAIAEGAPAAEMPVAVKPSAPMAESPIIKPTATIPEAPILPKPPTSPATVSQVRVDDPEAASAALQAVPVVLTPQVAEPAAFAPAPAPRAASPVEMPPPAPIAPAPVESASVTPIAAPKERQAIADAPVSPSTLVDVPAAFPMAETSANGRIVVAERHPSPAEAATAVAESASAAEMSVAAKPTAPMPESPVTKPPAPMPESPIASKPAASPAAVSQVRVDDPEATSAAIQAAPVVLTPQAAEPVASAPAPEAAVASAMTARAETISATIDKIVEAVTEQIVVTPALTHGDCDVRIILKPTVLEGSEILMTAKDGALTVAIAPTTPEVEHLVAVALPRLETALAEHVSAFRHVAVTIVQKKGKANEAA